MLGSGSRGDTLIEVLLAVTIFSMLAVGVITVMNQGTHAAQRALEITLVRQQIDAQAEALRAAQQTAVTDPTVWNDITGSTTPVRSTSDPCPAQPTDVSGAFVMNARNATRVTGASWLKSLNAAGAPVYAQVDYTGTPQSYGIWIERTAYPAAGTTPAAFDFRIRACWFGIGMPANTPMRLETIVRLYDPA
ncbi:TPA: hypothetical protein DIV49_03435 [Candidatus Saccharibacteria bacterium]|nr:hypothetical protein [Candidatus Saccharibacteria bacterium]HRJ90619.1 prepilin-type N-terminal cleavage/methylation domain-containing protein [Candidatus Saccharibacteria bacterium]